MKIITNNITKNQAAQTNTRDQKSEAGKFDAMLREAAQEKTTAGNAAAQSVSSVSGASPMDTTLLMSLDTSKIINGAEELVSTLEEFQTKLANANTPLEDLSPIVEKLDREKELLIPSLEILPQSDPLRAVLNNVLVQATVETEKFKRGDYL